MTYKNHFDFFKYEIDQWYFMAFFIQKKILAETQYKIYNQEFLAIIKAFNTWRYYLEVCKYEILILTDHNNLHWFIDIKRLSFC